MKLTTWKGFLKGMFLTTVVLLGSTIAIAVAIDAYPAASLYWKGVLIVTCLVALASAGRVGYIWRGAVIDYKAKGGKEE